MARKATQADSVLPESTGIDLTGLETGEELNPALQAIYAEMGQDEFGKIKVYIYKIIPETGKEPRIWEGPPGDYDLMTTAKRFGSGDYRVKLYVPHSSGRIVVGGNQVFPILLDPAEDQKIVEMREGRAPAQLAAVAAQPALTPESLAIAIAGALKAAMPAPVDAFAQLDKIAGIMSKIMPTQATVQPAGNTFMETLGAAKALMELTRGFSPPVDGEGRTDVKGMALARGIDVLARMFEKSIEQGKPADAGNAPKAIAAVASGEGEQANAETAELMQEQKEELEMLRLQIRMVNRQAAANAEIDKLVEDYYGDLPDQVFDLLVLEPKWFEMLCANVPECAQYKDWYERMRTAIIAKGMKEGDLKANGDGSLSFVEEGSTTVADGTTH